MLENARSKSRQKRRLHRPFVPSAESSYSQVVQINKLFARSHPCPPNIASSCRLRPGIFPDNSNRTCDPSDADQLDANPLELVRNGNNIIYPIPAKRSMSHLRRSGGQGSVHSRTKTKKRPGTFYRKLDSCRPAPSTGSRALPNIRAPLIKSYPAHCLERDDSLYHGMRQ